MTVYFAEVGHYIKVGRSDNPERRVRNLFKSETRYSAPADCPTDLASRRLLGVVPGHSNAEAVAHAALDDFRVQGEFFVDEPEVRAYISRCLVAGRTLVAPVVRPAGPISEPVSDYSPELAAALESMWSRRAS